MTEVIFEVTESDDGRFEARAHGHSIFTQGEDWNELIEMAREAVLCHFDEAETPKEIKLHHQVREDVIAVRKPLRICRENDRLSTELPLWSAQNVLHDNH